ncbi:MAG: alpha/beta fold hydrolase [Verrucomicrobiales bacterium]|nr:alpha/beta fold hydrolase [Verrucomicrobiales bacterium]
MMCESNECRRAGRWRRRWVWGIGSVLVVAGLGEGVARWAGESVVSPPRRGMQDYHREILADPAAHGLQVEAWTAQDGTPCLLCRPDATGRLGERGRVIREQIRARQDGVAALLRPVGEENGGVLVLLHGRRGRKEDNLPVAARFAALGFVCVLPDLPGHGEHPTAVASYGVLEAGLPQRVLVEAVAKFGLKGDRAGLWGISMGGSVAVHAAAQDPGVWRALEVVASFDALEPVVGRQVERWLGAPMGGWMRRRVAAVFEKRTGVPLAQVRPVDRIREVRCPTLVIHGVDDPLIPLETGRALWQASGAEEKGWVRVEAGTHGNVLVTPQPIYVEMGAWFLRALTEKE